MAKAHVTDGQDLAVWILDGLGSGVLTPKAWYIEPLGEADRLYKPLQLLKTTNSESVEGLSYMICASSIFDPTVII